MKPVARVAALWCSVNMTCSDDTIIEFRKVRKRFGRLRELCGIDLELRRGQTTVVIGESGTGKSVLL